MIGRVVWGWSSVRIASCDEERIPDRVPNPTIFIMCFSVVMILSDVFISGPDTLILFCILLLLYITQVAG